MNWIPIGERLPTLGPWDFYDRESPGDGARRSKCVPVLLRGAIEAWAERYETTGDRGETVEGGGWQLHTDFNHGDDGEVTHWFELPLTPRRS